MSCLLAILLVEGFWGGGSFPSPHVIILIIFFLKGFKLNAGKFLFLLSSTCILDYISLIECDRHLLENEDYF